jgi:predicted dehydrogenase
VAQIEGMNFVAYCDIVEERAVDMLKQYGGDYATADVDRIMNDPSIDAVYITTQHDTHSEYCIRALDAGKHVMVEKPLALSVEQCLEVGAAVARSKRKLMTAFKMRYFDMLAKAKELIPNPLVMTMQMMDNRWGDDVWANDPVKGGGNVLSQGVHSCDILRYVAGCNPVEVYACGKNYYQKSGVIDNLAAVFRFENGSTASWVQGDCHRPSFPSKFYMQLFAENRSVTLHNRLTTLYYDAPGEETQIYQGSETGFLEENIAFYECLRDDTPPPIDHIDGLYATLMVLQAFKSIASGKPEPIRDVVEQALSGNS